MFIVNVEGAIYRDGKWLLVKRSEKEEHAAGMLALVGGKCEIEGNSKDILERTLQREVFEEVGIEITVERYVNSSSFVSDSGFNVVDIVFLCKHKLGEPFAKSMDEVDDVLWMTTSEIMAHPSLPSFLKENVQLADQLVKIR